MKKVFNEETGKNEVHFPAVIVSMAPEEKWKENVNGNPYAPSTFEFTNNSGQRIQRSGLLYINQYPDATVGEEIQAKAVYSPDETEDRKVIIVSNLAGARRATTDDFDFAVEVVEETAAKEVVD